MFQTTNQYSSNILGTVVPNFGFLGGPKSARPSFLVTPVSPSFLESKVAGKNHRNRENPQLAMKEVGKIIEVNGRFSSHVCFPQNTSGNRRNLHPHPIASHN